MERREYVTFSPGEMSDFLEQIQDDMMYPVILCTYIYGLRRSEVLGLQWDAVDFDSDRITIRRTVVKVTETIAKDKTKTQRLGISDIQTTANIYGHIDVQRKKELVEAISITPKKPQEEEADHGKSTEPC